MCFSLSSLGLGNINYENHESNFRFSFENSSFLCPLFVAEFLSPKVSKLLKSDPLTDVFQIHFEIFQKDTIEQIFKLIHGESINIEGFDNEVVHFLLEIGNNEVLSTDFSNKFTNENAINLLEYKIQYNVDISKEIRFCSMNFESLKDKISSINTLNLILDCPSLKLNNEGSLFSFITHLIVKDKSYSSLLRFVKCEYLFPDEIDSYISILDSHDSEFIGSLWPSLRKRINNQSALPLITRYVENLLRKEKSSQYIYTNEIDRMKKEIEEKQKDIENLKNQNETIALEKNKEGNQKEIAILQNQYKEKEDKILICEKVFPAIKHISTVLFTTRYDGNNKFLGIFRNLSIQCKGNVVDKGIVSVEFSSTSNANCPPRNIFEEGASSYWISNNTPNSWIKFDFIDKKVLIEAYSILAARLRSFKIDCSNNGINWVQFDTRNDVPALNGDTKSEIFTVFPNSPFRFYKFTQTDKRWSNDDHFCIYQIEFFGSLIQ